MSRSKFINAKLGLGLLAFLIIQDNSHAMPGMHKSSHIGTSESSSKSVSIGEPINSSATEIEITYSADGKTALFVSTREGSIESPGTPYNFDIWMSVNDGAKRYQCSARRVYQLG